jgi:hypothetical protein
MATQTATNYLDKAGNLSGLASVTSARSNLGLGTIATASAADYLPITGGTINGNLGASGVYGVSVYLNSTATDPLLDIGSGVVEVSNTNSNVTRIWGTGVQFPDSTFQQTAGIGDAPTDGQIYGRQYNSWVVASGFNGGTIYNPLTVTDSTYYDNSITLEGADGSGNPRISLYNLSGGNGGVGISPGNVFSYASNGTGTSLLSTGVQFPDNTLQTTAGIGDAPANGSQYARKNNGWEVVSGGGGVTYATDLQAITATSTTTAINPRGFKLASLSTNTWAPNVNTLSSGQSGTGANAGSSYTSLDGRLLAPSAATAGYATRAFTLRFPSNAFNAAYNFGTESGHSVRAYTGNWGATAAGVKMRAVFGRMGGGVPVPATLNSRSYGWEWNFANRTMNIIAHNGTTLTTAPVTWNPVGFRTYEIAVTSNGAGTITLYIDGVQMGTSSGGPTDANGISAVWWQTEIQNEATAASQLDFFFQNPKLFTTNG